ncbi:Homeodomain-like protein [Parathielavia appendiculata]|uniref:Homeodomain-like protein n=1 Tax=Parathielavia appendiculata TaxID=2587402 RepID=A0AAN6U4S6_9PEZI|nr:Homeodomain-like protein [Parathielavia appendiculata]
MSAEIAPQAVSTPTPPRERHSLTLDQRRALRRWASSQPVRPSHKACIDWFKSQYNQTISQSTVSHSLSPKYARLDGDTQLSGSRLRFGNWPDVEKLVLLWHQQMVNNGRHPSNEELAEKAKNIFTQLPRYKDESPPEFSPGWIHRFKKRYGLLIRTQRRHGSAQNVANDIPYLVDTVPRFMTITPDVSPAAIREAVQRVVGVEASLATCARVRDEIVRRLDTQQQQQQSPHPQPPATAQAATAANPHGLPVPPAPNGEQTPIYTDDDPEVVLQNALRALQQEEADAEAQAAAEREARDRSERGLPPLGALAGQSYTQQAAAAVNAMSMTPISAARASVGPPPSAGAGSTAGNGALGGAVGGSGSTTGGGAGGGGSRFIAPTPTKQELAPAVGGSGNGEDLTLTPIPSGGPVSVTDRPVRCPFCLNQRMLRTIKEAVEHMSTHVIV